MRLGVEVCGLHVCWAEVPTHCYQIWLTDEINVTKGATMLALVPVVGRSYMHGIPNAARLVSIVFPIRYYISRDATSALVVVLDCLKSFRF